MRWLLGLGVMLLVGMALVRVDPESRAMARQMYVWSWTHLTDQPIPPRFQ